MDGKSPLISKRKTTKKPTYTNAVSRDNRIRLLKGLRWLGVNPQQSQDYGTIEQLILGEDLYRDGGVIVDWASGDLPDNPDSPHPREIAIYGKVKSRSKKKQEYPFTVTLEHLDHHKGKVKYLAPKTVDVPHQCDYTSIEELKKFLALKCCAHRVAVQCYLIDEFPRVLERNGIHHVEIVSYYKDFGLLPMNEVVKAAYYKKFSKMKMVEKHLGLAEMVYVPGQVYVNDDWEQSP